MDLMYKSKVCSNYSRGDCVAVSFLIGGKNMSMFNLGGNKKETSLNSVESSIEFQKKTIEQVLDENAEKNNLTANSKPASEKVAANTKSIPKSEKNVGKSKTVNATAQEIYEMQKTGSSKVKSTLKQPDLKRSFIKKPRNLIEFSKMGSYHLKLSLNNQDFAYSFMNVKGICDGCSGGKHSEVGSMLFGNLFEREVQSFIECIKRKNPVILSKYVQYCDKEKIASYIEHIKKGEIPEEAFLGIVRNVFERMLWLYDEKKFVFDSYCFTILVCFEYENRFVVYACGDGYIIKESSEGITFDKLYDGKYPKYYIYNWGNPKYLKEYKECVEFKVFHYPKSEYINIGVASDGLQYFDDLYVPEQEKFKNHLHNGEQLQIEKLINRTNHDRGIFKDDISICF
jgi:hypothetical protein